MKTEPSDWLEAALSKEEQEQFVVWLMYGSWSMFELLLSFGNISAALAPPPLPMSKKESSEIGFFNCWSSKPPLSIEQSSWLLAWLHILARSPGRWMMGSEQRRLNGCFVLKVTSAGQEAEEEAQRLGLREEKEPLPPRVEQVLSTVSPSPSGSVLSYAES